ncbi:peroxiredoxin-like family protein [Acaryochloris marina]|uniref:thioredoxin-dependent peroxiredoxin n=1 Tax=Acaryochloris marina (strain MBIC 11017) TaxID=329726 RepID=B0CBN5_ACAM1|nr:peroxiredoxin-like family protein [Acaryochloris marina]ABW29153.1 redoxin domain protein, putative AhpC/TSA family [Acaryochloris marina MBIC11017]BDM78097.1 peroxiredoxin [Acaryochloris marina MBIC10699]
MSLATELQAVTENVRQQAPENVFTTMEAATAKLAATGITDQALQTGQTMPDFELPDATGKSVSSSELRAKGLLLISFYRGNWCPYCNLELQALQARLDDIAALGATLVAISPESPDQSLTTQEKFDLKFPVLTDTGNQVARQFGLVFTLDESLRPIYNNFGIDITTHNGDQSFELPVPATYLVAADGTVLNHFVDVDYRERLAPETALAWLQAAQ